SDGGRGLPPQPPHRLTSPELRPRRLHPGPAASARRPPALRGLDALTAHPLGRDDRAGDGRGRAPDPRAPPASRAGLPLLPRPPEPRPPLRPRAGRAGVSARAGRGRRELSEREVDPHARPRPPAPPR